MFTILNNGLDFKNMQKNIYKEDCKNNSAYRALRFYLSVVVALLFLQVAVGDNY